MKQEMSPEILKDIVDWDVVNWSKAIEYWEKTIDLKDKNLCCLELGGNKGGLSLWFALQGNNVICSDLNSPEADASALHQKYQTGTKITYEAIDASNIPYTDHFDVIAFKSILGGISRNGNNELKKTCIDQIHRALNKNGVLLFAENLEGSWLHKILRKRFVSWGKEWNYLPFSEIPVLFSAFKKISYVTVGFWGAFGRTEKQRFVLGKLDRIMEQITPSSKRYIVIGIAEK
jgi:SAM-dependent methyltransferase